MRIKNRYYSMVTPPLMEVLNAYQISYRTISVSERKYIVFYLYDDDLRKEIIESSIPQSYYELKMSELVFSKEEYENAEWYRFIPVCNKIPFSDNDTTFSYFCKTKKGEPYYDSNHEYQCGNYCLDKKMSLGNKKCIYSMEGIADHYWFINQITRDAMEEADIQGGRFDPVLLKKTMNPIDNIYQIGFCNAIPEGAVLLGEEWGIRCVLQCPGCGEKRFYPMNPNAYQLCLKKEYLGEEDIYVTEAWFGSGYGMHMVIGSKKLFRFITDNNMSRFFKIHPILTV